MDDSELDAEARHEDAMETKRDLEFTRDQFKRVRAERDALRIENARLVVIIDKLFEHASAHDCEGAECSKCAVIDCPHGEPLHFHHDGCPACAQDATP